MPRYIEADKAIEKLRAKMYDCQGSSEYYSGARNAFAECIKNLGSALAVDLVPPPVKCGECILNEEDTGNPRYIFCRHLHAYVPKDFGCIQGKRKDDAK